MTSRVASAQLLDKQLQPPAADLQPTTQPTSQPAPTDAPVQPQAEENPNRIVDVRVVGNRRVEAPAIVAALPQKQGQIFDPSKTSDDLRALWKLGYFSDVQLLVQRLPQGGIVYVHCWGGVGRTGLVVGCHLARHGVVGPAALERITELRRGAADEHRQSPENALQEAMVLGWPAGR